MPQKCLDCWGKGYRKVRNPACPAKTLRLPCDRCNGSRIDPGPRVVTNQTPEDLDVIEHRTGKRNF